MSCQEYLNRKTLIVGEVNSGKTRQTRKILRDLMNCGEDPIAVLDLAPEKIQGVGGKICLSSAEQNRVCYVSPQVVPPRLSGKSEEEIWALARGNRGRIEDALGDLWKRTWRTLIINDVSLYLQEGEAENLMSSIEGIPTLVINGYYGRYFGASAFSRREREQMEILMSRCDQIFFLPSSMNPSI